MLLNYHEMTMNEPRDSPARRKQFLVVCTVMATFFLHACLTSGLFTTVEIKEGTFPGGHFIYKFGMRDYAASNSMAKTIREDLGMKTEYGGDGLLHHIFLDDPNTAPGRQQRWMTGILVDDPDSEQSTMLLDKNEEISKNPPTPEELIDEAAMKLWPRLPYETAELAASDAAYVQFPFTNGFVSALINSYKVIPALRKYAVEKGEPGNIPVVISMCSVKQEMCTHYAPLKNGRDFLLGRLDSETHLATATNHKVIDWQKLKRGIKKIIPFGGDEL